MKTKKKKYIYEGINWKRKIKLLHDSYDQNIADRIQEIFRSGGYFLKYFLSPEHRFGCENIFTIFSMFPLKHRIYILEKLLDDADNAHNRFVIGRLSLAYAKNGDNEKAIKLLERALEEKTIDDFYYMHKMRSLNA